MRIKEVLGSAPLRAWKKGDAEHMDFPAASSGQSWWKLWAEDRAKPGKINGNYLWKSLGGWERQNIPVDKRETPVSPARSGDPGIPHKTPGTSRIPKNSWE